MRTTSDNQETHRTRAWYGLLCAVLFAAGCTATATVPESAAIAQPTVAEPTAVEPTALPQATAEPEPAATEIPATPVPPTAVPQREDPAPSELVWVPCPGGECTTVTVPLDYDDPAGPSIDVAVVRRRARDTEGRIGSLIVNFGGPGGESTSIFAGAGPLLGSTFEQFDIVTWDPRGIGQTARLACDTLGAEFPFIELDVSDGLDDEVAQQEAEFAEVVACSTASGPIIDHLGTVNVARDLEEIRIALGDEPLNYLGLSYGTQIGWVYATLFGESVRSMILDGAVPAGSISADDFVTQATAFERTFNYFDELCDREPSCVLADEGLVETFNRVAKQLQANPIDLGGGDVFTDLELRQAVLFAMYQPPELVGPLITGWINDAANGDARGLVAMLQAATAGSTPGAYQAVLCADGGEFPGPDGQVADYEASFAASETFGTLGEVVRCDLWPGEVELLPSLDSSAAPTILVVGNTFDPATPYESAVLLDQQLADSVLLTVESAGHTAVLDNPCAGPIAVDYLNNLIAPPVDTVCFTPGLFGVELRDMNDDVVVNSLVPESAADTGGVLVGDMLISVDGTAIVTGRSIPLIRAGTPSEWVLRRDGEELALTLTPAPRPWN